MADLGFSLAFARLRALGQGWDDSAEVVRDAAARVPAGGGWAPGVSGAVTSFASRWGTDLAALAARCEGVETRLVETVEAYESVDRSAGSRLDGFGVPVTQD